MPFRQLLWIGLALAAATLACNLGSPAPTDTPLPPTATHTPPPPATDTPLPPTATPEPSPTDVPPTPEPTVTPGPGGPEGYVDNRSGPLELMQSYINAINRHEYARAYGYWDEGSAVGAFEDFEAGFADTQAVTLTTGTIMGEGAAGSLFYVVPVTLHALTSGGEQVFAGCYTLHLSQPGVQAEPPFRPMAIRFADVDEVPAGTDPGPIMAAACPPSAEVVTPQAPPENDISADYYIDDRSSAAAVLRSFLNAVNRREYARAYGYYEEGAEVIAFEDFEADAADVAALSDYRHGGALTDAGAGQLYFSLPAAFTTEESDGEMTTSVGCFLFHLSQPAIQGVPFQPLGLRESQGSEAEPGADVEAMLAEACATP